MRLALPLFTLCVAALCASLHAEEMPDLREQILAARGTPAAAAFETTVTRIMNAPGAQILVRPYRGEDVGVKGRSWLDPRAKPQSPEVREVFGLSMSDQNQAAIASNEVPILAAASVLQLGGEALTRRLDDQLAEMATWSPLQREGWTLASRDAKLRYNPAGERLPVNDGNSWLATGWGVRAIVDTLEILGDDPLGQKHRPALLVLLAKEVGFISDDWRQKRPWFVQSNMTRTNQWMLPTEGLIRACIATGRGPGDADYELGVANLLATLNDLGAAGEFDEGLSYAMATIPSALGAARAMARAGDNRAVHHPFLKAHPLWFVHHFQPGRQVVNCFDANSGMPVASRDQRGYRDMLATYAFMLG
ncbi:MAG: heparinase, partial [Burkholderiales bacterium]|nr:heparinase [Opitutaceae bacterium]